MTYNETIVAKKLPEISATAVMPDNTINTNFNFNNYSNGKIGVLFFYPLNFTFVCPSELIALNESIKLLDDSNIALAAVSVDSHHSHLAYKNTTIEKGGIGNVQYPIISDLDKSISKQFGVLHNDSVAFRATIISDQNAIVRHYSVNDLPIGRSVDEIIRIADAITHHNMHGEVCPANWRKGAVAMVPTTKGVIDYLNKN